MIVTTFTPFHAAPDHQDLLAELPGEGSQRHSSRGGL
jgi:hypothetical protein